MRHLAALIMLTPLVVGAAELQKSVCFTSEGKQVCLFQDARLNAGRNGEVSHDEIEVQPGGKPWKPPLSLAELRTYDVQGVQMTRLRVNRLSHLLGTGLKDAGRPVFLLTEDRYAGFGSYSGVTARPFIVDERAIRFIQPQGYDPAKPFVMMSALKSGWKETKDGFLLVSCAPDFAEKGSWDGKTFRIRYSRLQQQNGQWLLTERSERGYWEDEDGFPDEHLFPK
jgi:hypothetical protein